MVLKDDVFFGVGVYCYDVVHSCISWKESQNYSFFIQFLKVLVTLIFSYFGRKVKSSMDTNSKKTIKLFTPFHGF